MIGRRIETPFAADGGLIDQWPQPGDYWFYSRIGWQCCTPDGRIATLTAHDVTEHEDRTITVSPSLLVGGGDQPGSWHGYLEREVWRTV